PKFRGKEDQNGKEFQSSEEHQKTGPPFSGLGKPTETGHGIEFPKGDPHIPQTRCRDTDGRDKIQAHKSKEQGTYDKDQHIKDKEADDVVHNMLGDRPMVVAHRNNGTWVQAP